MNPARRSELVKEFAVELGFDSAGVADLSPVPHADELDSWLSEGMAGTMTYMYRQSSRRKEPARIVQGATRAVVVTRNYFNNDPEQRPRTGLVAKYARGKDYHTALRTPLEELANFIRSLGDDDTLAKFYVDTGPVPERELAQRAGLGWIGKNTMLIDPKRGSFFFIACVFTDLDLKPDQPFEADRCGTCTRCLEACPTNAFPKPRVLDSRLCISYLTIEHKGEIPVELAPSVGDWVFGCDICQDVCPWNVSFARVAQDTTLAQQRELAQLDLAEFINIGDIEFRDRYSWTALERPGPAGMRRNAQIVAANQACKTP